MNEDYEEKNEYLDTNTESFYDDEGPLDTNAEVLGTSVENFGGKPKPHHHSPCCCCCKCCKPKCCETGELVKNGGMEAIWFNKPKYWLFFNPSGVESEHASGNVHTGNSSVNIKAGSKMEQKIDHIKDCTVYKFSFFAKGRTMAVGLTAKVIFLTHFGPVVGATIMIRPLDMIFDGRDYGYYRILTDKAPRGTFAAIIKFTVNGAPGQKVNIDDVSFYAK